MIIFRENVVQFVWKLRRNEEPGQRVSAVGAPNIMSCFTGFLCPSNTFWNSALN
jgi:hypothetical protein